MRKIVMIMIVMIMMALAIMAFVPASAMADWKEDIIREMKNGTAFFNTPTIDIKATDKEVTIIVTAPKLIPKGGGTSMVPAKVKFASGVLKQAGKDAHFALVEVKDNKVSITIPNYAKELGDVIVEHVWGIGTTAIDEAGYLVIDPNDPYAVYDTSIWGVKTIAGDKADTDTLAIGILMCPNGKVFPLKSIKKGKVLAGRHPELAEFCK